MPVHSACPSLVAAPRRGVGAVVLFCLLAALPLLFGCAGEKKTDRLASRDKNKAREPEKKAAGNEPDPEARDKDRAGEQRAGKGGGERPNKAAQPVRRKIIYTGQIAMQVPDFDRAAKRLHELIAEYNAYVASSEEDRVPGKPRHGIWTVRVPVARSDEFRDALRQLGSLQRSTLDSRDVTDQYYDTQAEQTNLEAREKAVRRLYDKTIGNAKLTDLLEVDRELGRVRGEINTLKGRLQRWDKEIAYATCTVTIYERHGYDEPSTPGFATIVSDTFDTSINGMITLARFLVLVVVALAPWMVVLAVVGMPIWSLARRARKRVPPLEAVPGADNAAPPSPRE